MKDAKKYNLSPSAAARWVACPGSEYIIRQLPRLPSTPAAEEGTLAHTFAAWMLAGSLQDITGKEPLNGMPEEPEHALATEDMLNAAQIYADAVSLKVGEIMGKSQDLTFGIEMSLQYPDASAFDIHGRLDFCAVIPKDTILVADFKYGGAHVPTSGSLQLLTYAWILFETSKLRQAEPRRIIVGIVQPRSEASDFADYGASWYEYTRESFESIITDLKQAAERASNADEKSIRETGSHCKYCPARSVCRAAIGEKMLLAGIAAGEAALHEDATNEQIGAWLEALKDISIVKDDLTRIAKMRIEKGEIVPGWRIQRRKSRQWPDSLKEFGGVSDMAAELARRLDAKPEDFIATSLKSPAQMSKTLPKEEIAKVTEETTTTALISNGSTK